MSSLRILTVTQAAAAGLPWPDFYFTPGYGHACECSDGGEWRAAVWDEGPILHPFLLRPIPGEPGSFDLSSPYGYPGTWAPPGTPATAWADFRRAFRAWATENGVASEFLRMTSLVPGREALLAADPGLVAREHNQTVAIDTSKGYEAAWDAFESRARTKMRKARNNGLQPRWKRAGPEDVAPGSPFRTLYEANMRRIEASPYYFFSDEYFKRFVEGVEVHLLEVVAPDGRIAASAMALPFGELSHLHLVGTEDGANTLGIGPYIYDESTRWACERGHRLLHIGGGLKPGDSLFYFKSGFGGVILPYWVGRSVLDEAACQRLTQRRAEALGVPVQALLDTGYFPPYRAPKPASPPPA